jgi:hypothetical protein
VEVRDLRNEVRLLHEQAAAREASQGGNDGYAPEEGEREEGYYDDDEEEEEEDDFSQTRGAGPIQIRPKTNSNSNSNGNSRNNRKRLEGGAALAVRHEAGAAIQLEQLDDLHVELEILQEWKSGAEGEMYALSEHLAEAMESNVELEHRARMAEDAAVAAAAQLDLAHDRLQSSGDGSRSGGSGGGGGSGSRGSSDGSNPARGSESVSAAYAREAREAADSARRDAAAAAEVTGGGGGGGSPRRESSGGVLPLPSIGEEGEYLEDEEDEDGYEDYYEDGVSYDEEEEEDYFAQRINGGGGGGSGSGGPESDGQAMMREMWGELQQVRVSYKNLHNKYVRQSQRFTRVQEHMLELRDGGGGGGDTSAGDLTVEDSGGESSGAGAGVSGGGVNALLRYTQQHPPGLSDSARSSVIMGELSEESVDAPLSPDRRNPGWSHQAQSAVAAAAAAVAAGVHHHNAGGRSRAGGGDGVSASDSGGGSGGGGGGGGGGAAGAGAGAGADDADGIVEVNDVEDGDGMDGEDEVLAEYVSVVPPRGGSVHVLTACPQWPGTQA